MKQVFTYLLIIALVIFAAFFIYTNSSFDKSLSMAEKPNVIIILGDDIGYSDIGPYGSEIKTPNLDRLADEGIRFSQFYNMAKCEPSRSTLFTGLYEGGKNAVNFAQIFRKEGYYVVHSGKEHWMKWAPEHVRAKYVSDQSLTFRAMSEFFEPPSKKWSNPFILNGEEVGVDEIYHEREPFFKTDALTDNALKWIDKPVSEGQPFLLFLGYGAAHYPLQARPGDIAKYRGTYKKGWDKIREERMERLIERGYFPEGTQLSPPSSNINKFRGHPKGDDEIRAKIPLYRPWESLNEKEQDDMDLEMSVFAAMVDRMDQNIGRVLNYLDEKGIADNTIVMFLSDNGSCPYDSNRDFDYPPGVAEGFRTLSAAWANAGNTPYKYFKQYGHEGGTQTHFILRWPKTVKAGQLTHQQGHIVDIAPTLFEATKTHFPKQYGTIKCQPLQGQSLLPILEGKEREEPDFFMSGWTDKFRMFRQKEWKIVKLNNEDWELYNLKDDPTELNNLATEMPEMVEELATNYQLKQEELKAQAEK
ncbi:arylsulfatase [Prolixibacteraceae bacterium Z1-6]|uniref:Arylsulfatase n=1 Tax=Draconibacterium aestuarii TaxID=2998507 RepID=A0A9X3J5F8_9BACT|nr:arylsulfatase [Prolixibacteraceae bacterium Z1-6]